MFVIAQYMLSASTVFPRRPAKAVVCQLFQLLYLLSFSRGNCPLTPSFFLITPSASRASVRGKCTLTPSAFS